MGSEKMATYKDLNSFLKAIEKDLEEACVEIGNVAQEKLQSAIDDIELSENWESRSDLGLADSFKSRATTIDYVEKNGNTYDIVAENIAVGELYDRDKTISEVFTEGIYEFGHIEKHTFIEDTQQEVNKEVINILDKHLK